MRKLQVWLNCSGISESKKCTYLKNRDMNKVKNSTSHLLTTRNVMASFFFKWATLTKNFTNQVKMLYYSRNDLRLMRSMLVPKWLTYRANKAYGQLLLVKRKSANWDCYLMTALSKCFLEWLVWLNTDSARLSITFSFCPTALNSFPSVILIVSPNFAC